MYGAFRPWFWLVLFAFVATRFAGVHLHMCFDGQEAPAAVHMADGAVHHDEHHATSSHNDRDIDLFDAALLKKVADTDVLIPLFFAALLFLLRPSPYRMWPRWAVRVVPADDPLRLKPPLRGPPL